MKTRHVGYIAWTAPLIVVMLVLCMSGCDLGYFNIYISIPLGLNGTIGLLNPDGGVPGPGIDFPDANDGTIIPPDDL